ncbi:MAG: hypothetical protein KGZ89_08910 [Actinobacteria bacterium]|nr:hypothetical protein [Actinomycetota bacterium]
MANVMSVFQDVDKCMRCNGCTVGCKRTWKMMALNPGVHRVAPDQRIVINSQRRLDMGPFIRFSCWHCPDPPCVKRCPFVALVKQPNGAVSIDPVKCRPGATNAAGVRCTRQCVVDCPHGGYPRVGIGSDLFPGAPKAWKCTLCHGRAGSSAQLISTYGNPLPANNNHTHLSSPPAPETAHEPTCVYTCPAKAMLWDTRANIRQWIRTGGYLSFQGNGSVMWASKKYVLAAPRANPLDQGQVGSLMSSVLASSVAQATAIPTLIAGGVFAAIARRIKLAEEATDKEEGVSNKCAG